VSGGVDLARDVGQTPDIGAALEEGRRRAKLP
jgi:hypothetical protein